MGRRWILAVFQAPGERTFPMASVWRGADPYAYGRGVVHSFRRDESGIEIETGGTDWEEDHIAKNDTEYQPQKADKIPRKALKTLGF